MNKLLKVSIPVLLILGIILIGGCASAPSGIMPPMPPPVPSEKFVDEESYNYDEGGGVPGESSIDRKIIRTGYITLEVENITETMDKIVKLADELGGYVVSSHKHEYDERTSGSISIRIPVNKFEEAFDRLRPLAITVPSENTDSRDVTEEYVDLEARLRNLEATETQYLALLEKATTVEEMLKVQQALSNVRGEIERIEGRMQYLERSSDMSLIEVSLQEARGLAEPWSPSGAFKSAIRGLTAFVTGLATVFIWIIVFCWIWIPILVIWLRRRRKAKS